MTSEAGDEGLVYRPYYENDIAFIRSSWSNSYFKGCRHHKTVTPEEFHKFHRPLIDRFFDRPTATIIVVHGESEPDTIIGWIAVEILSTHLLIHYVYIKNTFKHEKLLQKIIRKVNAKNQPVFISHLTDKFKRIIRSNPKYAEYIYLPHLT